MMFVMPFERFKQIYWLEKKVFVVDNYDNWTFYVNDEKFIIKSFVNKWGDERDLMFEQTMFHDKTNLFFVSEEVESLEHIDAFLEEGEL